MKILNTVETARGKLVYSLFSEGAEGSERYGVTILSWIFGEEESASVHDITSDIDTAGKFLFILADNLVLPSTLSEVAEEYVASLFTV